MRIGYVRGGADHDVDLAVSTLEECGCDRVIVDSGARRPEGIGPLATFLARMHTGDDLVVVKLGHLAGSMNRLVEFLAGMAERGIRVQVADGTFSTSDANTGAVLKILWDFEQCTREGKRRYTLERPIGRPRLLADNEVIAAKQAIDKGNQPIAQIARDLEVSRATLYRSLRRRSHES